MAKRNIKWLGRLADNVPDYSKLERGNRGFAVAQYNLNELIHEAGDFYGPLAARKGLKIRYELQPGIPEIDFDHDGIMKVMTNLLSNAVKFTQRGGIVIYSKLQNDEVEIFVRDTGAGIREKDRNRLFQPFEKIRGEDGRKIEETGLGLTITKKIIEQHHGKIEIRSEIGRGTMAYFSLPIRQTAIPSKEPCLASE